MTTEKPDGIDEHGRPYVVRYVVTCKRPGHPRRLAHDVQGRCTYDTAAQARAWIKAARRHNSADTLRQAYGDPSSLAVRPCRCHPGHHDPLGVYFDD